MSSTTNPMSTRSGFTPNYRTDAGGIGNPHPLLQGGPLGPIEVFPDHPHEGECRVPSDLTTTFPLDGGNPREKRPRVAP